MNISFLLLFAILLGQPHPGAIAVVGGDLKLVTFELPEGTPYQLDYSWSHMLAYFDDEGHEMAQQWPIIYHARGRGDFDSNDVLDAEDIPGFVAALMGGPYVQEGDFNDDLAVDEDDLVLFVSAVLHQHPAEGVTLFVRATFYSEAMGEPALNLMTDDDENGTFAITQSQPMTLLYFESGSLDRFGEPIIVNMQPAIYPLVFDQNTSAEWSGFLELSSGITPTGRIRFDESQVFERMPSEAHVLIGDGWFDGELPEEITQGSVGAGYATGRISFNLNGHIVKTQEFRHRLIIDNQFNFVTLRFDDNDPLGYEPEHWFSTDEARVLHVADPENPPDLYSMLWYQVSLESAIRQSEAIAARALDSVIVDLQSFYADGTPLDSLTGIEMIYVEDDGDSFFDYYRSPTSRPLVLVDAAIEKNLFPELSILQTVGDGYMMVFRR